MTHKILRQQRNRIRTNLHILLVIRDLLLAVDDRVDVHRRVGIKQFNVQAFVAKNCLAEIEDRVSLRVKLVNFLRAEK